LLQLTVAKNNTSQGFNNFLKVTASAVTRPTRIATGLMSFGVAVLVPQIALPALIAGGIAILGMSAADINDPEFIQKVLRPADKTVGKHTDRIEKLIQVLRTRLNQNNLYPEVASDISESINTLTKIKDVLGQLPDEESGGVAFVVDQIVQINQKLLELINKEQIARKFLQQEDKNALIKDLEVLQQNIETVQDKVTKEQLQKVITQKQEQLANYYQVEQRMSRVDAYIANIRAALATTYTNLTRLQLKDEFSFVDETEVLTESMKQIVAEIDLDTLETVSPLPATTKQSTKKKQSITINN
jgi:hypothetical protein